jgi:hypothetical protein
MHLRAHISTDKLFPMLCQMRNHGDAWLMKHGAGTWMVCSGALLQVLPAAVCQPFMLHVLHCQPGLAQRLFMSR